MPSIEQAVTAWRARAAEKRLWRSVASVDELADLMARFCAGELGEWPDHGGPRNDETIEIAPALVAANRRGLLTIGSQPGEEEGAWRQRAAVEGFARPAVVAQLRRLVAGTRLVMQVHRPTWWRRDYSTAVAVTTVNGDPCTAFGATHSVSNVRSMFGEVPEDVVEEVALLQQVFIYDPEWGARDLLWDRLAEPDWDAPNPSKEPGMARPKNNRADGQMSSWHDDVPGETCTVCGGSGSRVDGRGQHVDACGNCRGWGKPDPAWKEPGGADSKYFKTNSDGTQERVTPPAPRTTPSSTTTRTHDAFGRPLSEADKRFFALRESGYTGWIDQDGYACNANGDRRARRTVNAVSSVLPDDPGPWGYQPVPSWHIPTPTTTTYESGSHVSIEQVKAQIAQGINHLTESMGANQAAHTSVEDGRNLLMAATEGSAQADVSEAIGLANQAMATMEQAGQSVHAAISAAEAVAARL